MSWQNSYWKDFADEAREDGFFSALKTEFRIKVIRRAYWALPDWGRHIWLYCTDPWVRECSRLRPGDRFLNCAGEVHEVKTLTWASTEFRIEDERGHFCHTSQCMDMLEPEDASLPLGAKLSDERLNHYWGVE